MMQRLWDAFWRGWEKWQRGAALTKKMAILTAAICLLSWWILDLVLTREVERLFQQHLLAQLNAQASRDRLHLDLFFRGQSQSAGLMTQLTRISHHIEHVRQSGQWSQDRPIQRHERAPDWLPEQAALRHLAHAPYILLLDDRFQVRETVRAVSLPPLPEPFLTRALPALLVLGGQNNITLMSGKPTLVTSAPIAGAPGEPVPAAHLALVAPLDDDFLSFMQNRVRSDSIVIFLNADGSRILASSRPDLAPSGRDPNTLSDRYLTLGKAFFDYGFYADIRVQAATLVDRRRVVELTDSLLASERRLRLIGYGALAIFFVAVIGWVAFAIERFTRRMVAFSREGLGLTGSQAARGDQLFAMEEQFRLMAAEIAEARKAEKAWSTQLERTNTALQESNAALQQSLDMVRRTQDQLIESEKMAALGGLVAGVAHEINTPVGIGVTAASLLERESRECADNYHNKQLRGSDLTRFLDMASETSGIILANLKRAADLIGSFKQVAVDQSCEQARLFPLRGLIDDVLLSLNPRLKKDGHTIEISCPDNLELFSYPGAIGQILTNLVINALAHGFEKGTVGRMRIAAWAEGDMLRFEFFDNGRGIDSESIERIFEPFFTTRRGQGGSGLGLFVAYNLATQTLGGVIEAESVPGQGATFRLRIPLMRGERDE